MLKFENNRIYVTNEIDSDHIESNLILIVDDNESIHEDLKKILTNSKSIRKNAYESLKEELFGDDDSEKINFHYELISAYQGDEAIELVKKAKNENKRFALIFMDVRMPPGLDGIETLSKIWEIDPNIEAVICSAYSDYPWEKIVEKLGTSDKLLFLEKPFATVEVQQMALALVRKWNLGKKTRIYAENLEEKIFQRTQQIESLLNNLNLSIIITEENGKIIFSNPMAMEFFSNTKIIGKNLLDIMKKFPEVKENLEETFKNRTILPQSFVGEKDRSIYKFTIMNLEEKTEKTSSIFLIEDITDWHRRVNTDGLTGLWNHRYFKEHLEKEIKKIQRYKYHLSLLMVDIDFFKNVNDTYGHQTGDIIIKSIAGTLQKMARETDIIARYGGEEFSLILPMTDEDGALILASRIRAEIEKTEFFDIFGKEIPHVTISIGVSSYNKGTFEEFIESADQALYYCKNNGRNCVIAYSELINNSPDIN